MASSCIVASAGGLRCSLSGCGCAGLAAALVGGGAGARIGTDGTGGGGGGAGIGAGQQSGRRWSSEASNLGGGLLTLSAFAEY